MTDTGAILPLYAGPAGSLAFRQQTDSVAGYDASGREVWSRRLGPGTLFGGFDLDSDGFVDFGLAKDRSLQRSCGRSLLGETWLEFYSGVDGAKLAETSPLEDVCHHDLNYATLQWTSNTVIFGATPGALALAPQYATTGWFYRFSAGRILSDSYIYPSIERFNSYYRSAQKVRDDRGRSVDTIVNGSHVQNGLIIGPKADRRLVFFTSGRVLQYRVGPLSRQQLLADRLVRHRPDTSGRNYGAVQVDPQNPELIGLVAGTSIYSLWADLVSGQVGNDPLGGIERHITIYNMRSNKAWQHFISSSVLDGGRKTYEDRIAYPAHFFLPTDFRSSSLLYNEFSNGVWSLHATMQGSTRDALTIPGLVAWDARDLDGDGVIEIVASPTGLAPGSYLPDWTTLVLDWDPRTGAVSERQRLEGVVPQLQPTFRETTTTASDGNIYPVLTGSERGQLGLYVRSAAGQVSLVPLCSD